MKLLKNRRTLVLLTVGALAPAAVAQGELWRFPGLESANAGDANADGKTDFVVLSRVGTSSTVTRAEVRSGADGSVLSSYTATAPFASVERPCGLGDIDGDGRGDFAVVEQRTTGATVQAISGATGLVLHGFGVPNLDRNFVALERLGDINGDGRPDYAVGMTAGAILPPPLPGGEVWLVSGATGSVIRTLFGPPGEASFGTSLARFDDLDADGRADIAVGSQGRVRIQSSLTGTTFFNVQNAAFGFGTSLAAIDDVDGDGRSELAIGAPGPTTAPTLSPTCSLFVYSVPSGALLRQWDGAPFQRNLAHLLESAGDFDGDGRGDVLYSSGHAQYGCCSISPRWVEIASVHTGNVLYLGLADDSGSLDPLGDIDGDGTVDYITGGHYYPEGTFGVSVMITGRRSPGLVWECSQWMANNTNSLGCAPLMGSSGAPSLSTGDPFSLWTRQFRNRVSAAMIASAASVPGVPFAQQALCLAGPRQYVRVANTGGSAAGNDCTGTLNVPLSPAQMAQLGWTAGSVLTVQCWARDPGFAAHNELSLSDALFVTIWP